MDSFGKVYALLKRRKTERQSPQWQVAAHSVTNKLPLNGQPKEFANPNTTKQYVVMARHRYKPNQRPFQVSAAYANAGRAWEVRNAMKRREEAKKFPLYVYKVEPL